MSRRYTLPCIAACAALALAACSSAPHTVRPGVPPDNVVRGTAPSGFPGGADGKKPGGYYLDDGPDAHPPPDLDRVVDATPRPEPLKPSTGRPYTVMGQTYLPLTRVGQYKERGIASWYGRRFHGKKTASGEIYDMYAMSAAHTTLPIPSYARVTNIANGKSVVVRVNDRGPFHPDRIIDLSYTAAYKLGVLRGGSAWVEVESLLPDGTSPVPATPVYAAAPALAAPSERAEPPAPSLLSPIAEAGAEPLPDTAAPLRATVPPPDPPPVVAIEPETRGLFLQLAAFGSRDNADSYLNRLRAQADWMADELHVYKNKGLFKIHAGPYATADEARAAAEHLGQALGVRAVIITR